MTTVISLGWNCDPAMHSVSLGLRPSKEDGYPTGPFDLMMSSFRGVLDCLRDDFANFFNIRYGDVIINDQYRFIFNHESPSHWDTLGNTEQWSGPSHFIENDFFEFKRRYMRRIANFYELISQGDVIFIYQGSFDDPIDLMNVIGSKFPHLNFRLININNYHVNVQELFLNDIRDIRPRVYRPSDGDFLSVFPQEDMGTFVDFFREVERDLLS